jgi:hypothetical protein
MNSESSQIMTLHRGIAVSPSEVREIRDRILQIGLRSEDSPHSKIEVFNLRPRIDELFSKQNLSREDTQPRRWVTTERGGYSQLCGGFPVICASGDELGASYYACKHNTSEASGKTEPLLITFQAPLEDVFIDGRDWLYWVFERARSEDAIESVVPLVGPKIRRYLRRALESEEHDFRCALCELAMQDLDVVLAHSRNKTILGGRGGTVFRSAFEVRAPVPPDRIVSVSSPSHRSFIPEVNLRDLLRA